MIDLDDEIESKRKEIKELRKRERSREIEDVKKVISSAEGRRFLWRLMSESGVFRASYTGDSKTFFNEGKRDIGLLVLREVNTAKPSAFAQMQNEFLNEQEKKKKKPLED